MRIQVLNLPDQWIDGEFHPRFVLVLDEHPAADGTPEGDAFARRFDDFARSVGAAGGTVCGERVEVVESTAAQDTVREVVQTLDELITKRLDEHVAARREEFHFHQSGLTSDKLRLLADRQRPGREA